MMFVVWPVGLHAYPLSRAQISAGMRSNQKMVVGDLIVQRPKAVQAFRARRILIAVCKHKTQSKSRRGNTYLPLIMATSRS